MLVEIPLHNRLDLGQKWILYHKDGHGIFLNPDIPFWFVFPDNIYYKLSPVFQGKPISKIKNIKKDEIEDLAWQYGLYKEALKKTKGSFSKTSLLTIHYYTTRKCNLHCIHCYMNSGEKSNNDEVPLQEIMKFISGIKDIDDNVKNVNISGGEPLIREGVLNFCSQLRCNGYYVSLLSNGTLINKQNVHKIAESVNSVQLSIDGASPKIYNKIRGANCYNNVINALTLLDQYKHIYLMLSICIMPQNIEDFKENLEKLLKKIPRSVSIGFDTIKSFGRGVNICKNYENVPEIESFVERVISAGWQIEQISPPEKYFGCGYGQSISIDTNGDVYPCSFLLSSFGNIMNDSPLEIFTRRNIILKENFVDNYNMCSNCNFRYICGGKYRIDNLKENGHLEPVCKKEERSTILLRKMINKYYEQRSVLMKN